MSTHASTCIYAEQNWLSFWEVYICTHEDVQMFGGGLLTNMKVIPDLFVSTIRRKGYYAGDDMEVITPGHEG